MSNVRYVNIIKVALFLEALFKVTSDQFISGQWLGLNVGSSLSELVIAI